MFVSFCILQAILNSYTFSVAYCLLYMYPFFSPLRMHDGDFWSRLRTAHGHWVVWMSCFTEIVFQIAHNVFVPQLNELKGTMVEWPFFRYGQVFVCWVRSCLLRVSQGGICVFLCCACVQATGCPTTGGTIITMALA